MFFRLEKIAAFWRERLRFQLRTGWDILWEARRAFSRDGCMNLAAAVAFYTILGAIPFFLGATGARSLKVRTILAACPLLDGSSCRLLP